jgi:Sulfotransferase family
MPNKVKVLYIAGLGRSGSTILGNTLGQLKGFVHVGELLEIWTILASGRVACGCGVPVAACNMWGDVLNAAYGGVDQSFVAQMIAFRNLRARDRTFVGVLTPQGTRNLRQRMAKPLADIETLYRAIQGVFNCAVIVDSSKYPMYAYLLHLMDLVDPYILHLTRDPRAVAYSFFCKRVKDGSLIWAKDMGPLNTALMWNYKNGLIEVLSNRFRHSPLHMRYEDFVADPRGSLNRVLRFVDELGSPLPLDDKDSLNLEVQHTVSGNPSRFVIGKVELRENHGWKYEMKWNDRLVVTAATLPLLTKYGYRLAA